METELYPGTWVEFIVDAFYAPDNIIVKGLLGVVDDHPYAPYICTPGISTMILPTGKAKSFGYASSAFVPLQATPSQEDIANSTALWHRAFDVYEEKTGYSGFVQVGKRVVSQYDALTEIHQLSAVLLATLTSGEMDADCKGRLKRIRKLLLAFRRHPLSTGVAELASELSQRPDSSTIVNTIPLIQSWCEQASMTWGKEKGSQQKRRILGRL